MEIAELVQKLPDCYRKDKDSNNYKLLQLQNDGVEALRRTVLLVEQAQDLRTAFGATLDLHGEEVEQPRGLAEDARYRVLIWNKMARDRCLGTQRDIASALINIMECDPRDFTLKDRTDRNRKVRMRVRDEQVIENSVASKTEIKSVLNQLLPAGVSYSLEIPRVSVFPTACQCRLKRLRIRMVLGYWSSCLGKTGPLSFDTLHIRSGVAIKITSSVTLMTNGRMGRLDGSHRLDGSRRLNAGQSTKEEL